MVAIISLGHRGLTAADMSTWSELLKERAISRRTRFGLYVSTVCKQLSARAENCRPPKSTRTTWAIVKTQLCMIAAGGPISALATQAQFALSPDGAAERSEKMRLSQLAQTQFALHNKAKRMKAILDGYILHPESDAIVRLTRRGDAA